MELRHHVYRTHDRQHSRRDVPPVGAKAAPSKKRPPRRVPFNVVVPPGAANGDIAVSLTYGGAPAPTGSVIAVLGMPPPNLIQNGSFESALAGNWVFSQDGSTGAAATITLDDSTSVDGNYSAEIDVTEAAAMTTPTSPCLPCAVRVAPNRRQHGAGTGRPPKTGVILRMNFEASTLYPLVRLVVSIDVAQRQNIGGNRLTQADLQEGSRRNPPRRLVFVRFDEARRQAERGCHANRLINRRRHPKKPHGLPI